MRRPWDGPTLSVAADVAVHYPTPVLFVAFWWSAVPTEDLAWRQVRWWCWYPAAYFGYVLLRGAATGRYPYPFLEAGSLGYVGGFADGIGLLVAFVALSLGFVAVGRLDGRRSGEA